ncbi:MAG: methyltransferase domain-containing protein [Anaerolineae bacterium]|nr:methyltransferase domain-containing protein [Anaerolineae bacterium]
MAQLAKLWWRLVRFGFHLLYNELAFTYDWVSYIVSLGEWRSWVRASLKYLTAPSDGLILELAHGTGNLQLDLNAVGYHTIGYDLSPNMGSIAQRKLIRAGFTPRLVRGRAQQLPFQNATFNAVISTFPTEFILAPETLREVHRVLRSAGQFIIVPNGVLTGRGATQMGLEWLYRITGQREGSGFDIVGYFAIHGFDAQFINEPCTHSIAQVILARKQD